MNAIPKISHIIPPTIDAILDEAAARREAAAWHEALNGFRSRLSLEGPVGEPGPSDAAVMEAVEGASSVRLGPSRFVRAA